MTSKRYIPEQGDIVWLDLVGGNGREQAGKRPAIVVSRKDFNAPSGLALVCPITTKAKGYPFEVLIIAKKTAGVALADQIRSLDWAARSFEFKEHASDETKTALKNALQALIS